MAVKRVNTGQGVAAAARGLGVVEQTLRNWVKAAKAGRLNKGEGKVVAEERIELSRLRTENIRLPAAGGNPKKKRQRSWRRMRYEVRLD